MARKLIEEVKEVQEDITTIIDDCYTKRTTMASLKTEETTLATKIKEYFKQNKLEELSGKKVIAKVTQTQSTDIDEEKLIELLKQKLANKELNKTVFKQIVKTKEYIDSDNLESAIYNDNIKAIEIAPCQSTKLTPKLTFEKIK